MPEWYAVTRAASYYGVAPWELAERPVAWVGFAMAAIQAEAQAEAEQMAAAAKRKK